MIKIPKFQYRAVTIDGQVVEGVLESYDYNNAVEIIRSRSLYPLDIIELKSRNTIGELHIWNSVSSKDLSIFCKQFASLIKAGVSVSESLDILADHISNGKLKNSIKNINRSIHIGKILSESFRLQSKCFPDILIRTIEASEIGGTLDISLERMAVYFQKEYALTQKFKKAMTYPIILTVTAIIVAFFMIQIIIPQFVKLFEVYGVEIPTPTRILLTVNDLIASHGVILLIFPLVIYTIIISIRSRPAGQARLHRFFLKLPLAGRLAQKLLSARFNRLLAMLMSSGISLTQSLEITAKSIGNAYIEEVLKLVANEVRKGKGLGYALKEVDVFTQVISWMISVGEEGGRLEEMMENMADFYEIELEISIEKIITMLEPLITIVLGGIIAIIVLATVMPIFNIYRFLG